MSEMMPKQPERASTDGRIEVTRHGENHIHITCTTNGVEEGMTIGRFNAWRLLPLLAFMLDIPLPRRLKTIKM